MKENTISCSGAEAAFPSYVPTGTEWNVRDLGAVGDGIADDSAAVSEAIGKARDSGGGTVYFPDGRYRISQKITFGEECILAFGGGACLIAEEQVKINGCIRSDCHVLFTGSGPYRYSLKNPYVTPVWFGAAGDGVTDDTEAFNAAISASSEILIPPTGKGYAVGAITLSKSVRIAGLSADSGEKPTLIGQSGGRDLFTFTADNIYISNLRIEMGDTGSASVFYFDTSVVGKNDHKLSDIDVYGAYRVVTDSGVVSNLIINTLIDRVNCYDCRGTAFYLQCFWGFIFIRNLTIDNSKTFEKYGKIVDFPAVRLKNNAGCVFQNMEIVGDGNGDPDQNGFYYNNNIATWMDNCTFRDLGGSAVKCTGSSSFLYFSNLSAEGCGGNAFQFKGITYPKIHALTVDGTTGKNGIVIDGCRYAQITGCILNNVVNNGISVSSSSGTSIAGCEITNCGEYGIYAKGSKSTNCVDCSFDGNVAGDHSPDVTDSSGTASGK